PAYATVPPAAAMTGVPAAFEIAMPFEVEPLKLRDTLPSAGQASAMRWAGGLSATAGGVLTREPGGTLAGGGAVVEPDDAVELPGGATRNIWPTLIWLASDSLFQRTSSLTLCPCRSAILDSVSPATTR